MSAEITEAKFTRLINDNFKKTEDLEMAFSRMTKIAEFQKQIKDVIDSHRDNVMDMENLENISSRNDEIKKIVGVYGAELKDLFEYKYINENLTFVVGKLQEKKDDLVQKIKNIPLDHISVVESFLSNYDSNDGDRINTGEEKRTLKVPIETGLFSLIQACEEPEEKKNGIATRLYSRLNGKDINTVGDLVDFWDNQGPMNLLKFRNLGHKSMRLLARVIKDKIFGKYTQSDDAHLKKMALPK